MFDPTTLVGFHTWLSIFAIVAGIIVVRDMLAARANPVLIALYYATAILTSVTGFGFPFTGVLPSYVVGVISLVILLPALYARYGAYLVGPWRRVDAFGILGGLYFLVFVAVAQSFAKVPALRALAPTQSEPPFAIAQFVMLAVFIWIAVMLRRGLRPTGA